MFEHRLDVCSRWHYIDNKPELLHTYVMLSTFKLISCPTAFISRAFRDPLLPGMCSSKSDCEIYVLFYLYNLRGSLRNITLPIMSYLLSMPNYSPTTCNIILDMSIVSLRCT
jgi:hypothetical protein